MTFFLLPLPVKSEVNSHWTRLYFTPVASVLLFNVGDLIGRTTATLIQWPGRKPVERFGLMIVTLLRIGKRDGAGEPESIVFKLVIAHA